MKQLKLTALAAIALLSTGAHAANLIANGDFETSGAAGYAAFGSDYVQGGDAHAPSVVNIGSNPNALHSGWGSFSALSGNSMLIVNGGTELGSNIVWSQTLNLSAGVYDFTGSAASTYGGNPSKLQAVVHVFGNDYVLGTVQLGSDVGQWQTLSGQVTVPFNVSVQVKLLNLSTDYSGNDFAVDNIALTAAVPEPESYALMLAGLGTIGFIARRRRA
jgi:hypothetical protein